MRTQKNEVGSRLPQAFTFNASNQQVRTVVIDGKPFFVAKDVCAILGISNHKDAVSRLDDDERDGVGITDPIGRQQQVSVVNESGLYHLIFQSRKPEAKAFRKWVTSEVLPSLRKSGKYEMRPKAAIIPNPGAGGYLDLRSSPYIPNPGAGGYLDLRSSPYTTVLLKGYRVRTVRHEDVDWYSLNDIHTAFQTRTDSHQDAGRLQAAGNNLVKKILIFGNTQPAWFVSGRAMELLICRYKASVRKNGGK